MEIKQKYCTRGINNEVPMELQLVMWELVETIPVARDYLQIFEVITNTTSTTIFYKQEVPEYEATYDIKITLKKDVKVYVIIDGNGIATMMLTDEY